jgi:Rv2258c-like winged HTH domain
MGQAELNQSKMEEFGGRALDILNKASVAVMMSVGHRTGLFEAMVGSASVNCQPNC